MVVDTDLLSVSGSLPGISPALNRAFLLPNKRTELLFILGLPQWDLGSVPGDTRKEASIVVLFEMSCPSVALLPLFRGLLKANMVMLSPS